MNNYKLSGLTLKKVHYNFAKPDRNEISVSVQDSINILEIRENETILDVSRVLSLGPKTDTFVKVGFEVVIECDNPIEKQNIIDALKSKSISLVMVFSKASLLISQTTSMSPFGVIVTPPSYDPKVTEIQ